MHRVRLGAAVLVASGVLLAVGVFVPSVHLSSYMVTNRASPTVAEASGTFSSWTLFADCGRRSVFGCEIKDEDSASQSDNPSTSVPHGVPLLAVAALLVGVGALAIATGKTTARRALVAWGSVLVAAITVGLMFLAIDGTLRDFDVGRTTAGIWMFVVAIAVAFVGALMISRSEWDFEGSASAHIASGSPRA